LRSLSFQFTKDGSNRLRLSASSTDGELSAGEVRERARELSDTLARRLAGEHVDIPWNEFDLSGRADFHLRIWKEMYAIPFGKTATYAEIARAAGSPKAFRACGQACGANPIVLFIPCHRVVSATGLGGFSSGLEWKKLFLAAEG